MLLKSTPINDRGFFIRDIRITDSDSYQTLLLHPDVKQFIPEQLLPNSLFDTIRTITALKALSVTNTGAYWAICNPDNELIGAAGFETWHHFHKRLELAFELHPDYQGQGLMTQALKVITKIGFDQMHAERIEAFTLTSNEPSIKVLKRIGFEHEGELKKYRMFNQEIRNIHLFALTK
jgi:[ribosomal protein S5]-alanine N-acetyltransferase